MGQEWKAALGEVIPRAEVSHLTLLGLQEDSGTAGGISSTSASVNRYILQLAQEYCGDCKSSFDELSKIIQVRSGSRLQGLYASRAAVPQRGSHF